MAQLHPAEAQVCANRVALAQGNPACAVYYFEKGFIVYYLADDSRNTVFITAVIYGKRNQIAALKQFED